MRPVEWNQWIITVVAGVFFYHLDPDFTFILLLSDPGSKSILGFPFGAHSLECEAYSLCATCDYRTTRRWSDSRSTSATLEAFSRCPNESRRTLLLFCVQYLHKFETPFEGADRSGSVSSPKTARFHLREPLSSYSRQRLGGFRLGQTRYKSLSPKHCPQVHRTTNCEQVKPHGVTYNKRGNTY